MKKWKNEKKFIQTKAAEKSTFLFVFSNAHIKKK
jgi:hypothetical protein